MATLPRLSLAGLLVALASPLAAQAGGAQRPAGNPGGGMDPTGAPDTSLFAPLNLPTGNVYRSGSGTPGPRYWQQRVDYDLHGTLDTAAKSLQGEMTLRYTNNSPDTLRFLWFQVEQNAFKNGSLNSFVFPAESRFGARNFEGGDVIDRFNQVTGVRKTPLKMRVEGTVKLEAVVDSDGTVKNVIVVSGHSLLKATAVDCVKQWEYEPTKDTSLVAIDITFKLPN